MDQRAYNEHRRFVALLRGVNVGRAKRVAMADLRAAVAGLGFWDVKTLLNSGNVVFTGSDQDSEGIARSIEATIESTFGFTSRVAVLAAAELAAIVLDNPILHRCDDPSRFLVAMFQSDADVAAVEPLAAEEWHPDALAIGSRAAYLWCESGILESRLAIAVGRTAGERATTRNWSTIVKLNALANGG